MVKIPRNANLPIGVVNKGTRPAIQENGVPGWHSRGYLPHFDSPHAIQHVVFHLADSLPSAVLRQFDAEINSLPAEKHSSERRKRIDAWMDAGHGSCILREPFIALAVRQSLLNFNSQLYCLIAWVVMPNHVHVLFQPLNGWTVAKVVASWKKFTAGKICRHRRQIGEKDTGQVWHREYWDRYIRDDAHLAQVIEYIRMNPVKARLCAAPESWPWCSASSGTPIS